MSDPQLLDAVLAPGGITVAFQPIFRVGPSGRTVAAVECLARGPRGTNLESAGVLFEYVRRKREETAVDRACVVTALMAARRLPSNLNLTLNVHASTLGRDPEFTELLTSAALACGIDPTRLVVEIVEHAPYWDGPTFNASRESLRRAGIAIALDDVGLGFSNYKMMVDCHPEYLKVDRYLISGCDTDPYRVVVIESIHQLAEKVGAEVVAEGVETQGELDTLQKIGIGLYQGYLLSANHTEESLYRSGVLEMVDRGSRKSAPPPMLAGA